MSIPPLDLPLHHTSTLFLYFFKFTPSRGGDQNLLLPLPFNPKGFQYSYAWSHSLCERRTFFCTAQERRSYLQKTLQILTYVFNWLYFTQYLTSFSFSSIDHIRRLCALFLILFYLTQKRFSRSAHLLMCLSLETLMSIIRTAKNLKALSWDIFETSTPLPH